MPDVREPGGRVGRALPPETVLRRQQHRGIVPFVAQRLHERPRDHEVPAFDEQRRRRDDSHPH